MSAPARQTIDQIEAGLAHHRVGAIAKAEACYKRALAASPGDPRALHLLGLAAFDKGRPERALQLISKALARDPANPDFLHSAGHILQSLERYDEAASHYHDALEKDPGRALTRSNLGNTLKRSGRLEEAAAQLAQAVEISPDFAEGWSNLGLVHKERGDFDAAIDCQRRAAGLRPTAAVFSFNLANTLEAAGRRDEAIGAYRRALTLDPAHRGARVSLGATLRRMGRLDESTNELERALALNPADAEARWNMALAQCMAGHWASGLENFEARRRMPGMMAGPASGAEWDGRPIPGRTLLVQHEQGMGDAIQFLRFAADVEKLGARVIYRGPEKLLALARRISGVSGTSSLDAPLPRFDVWAPMMSLPRLVHAASGQRLGRSGYLLPEPERVARWHERLSSVAGLRIGVAWQGNPDYAADRERSLPLAMFERLSALPGVTLIGLQQGAGREQIAGWPKVLPFVDLAPELDSDAAFMDTAAVLPALDLVISSDTALAHLAGAVGVPAWLALAHVPDWRWGLEGERSVWYPTVHVYRQPRPGDWKAVFADMTEALGARIGAHG